MVFQNSMLRYVFAAFAVVVANGLGDHAQASLSITSTGQAYTEDFSTFVGTAASVPDNFSWTDSDFSPGGIYDASGSYVNSNSTYALTFGTSGDYAFGSKSPTSGTDYLNWSFVNSTGGQLTSFLVSWDVEQYSAGGRATEIDFNYNSNSTGYTQDGIDGITLTIASTGSNDNLSEVATTSRQVVVTLNTPLENGEEIRFGWGISNGSGSGSNGHIGVDNLSVSAIAAVPEAGSILLGTVACSLLGLSYLGRRKREAAAAVSE